METLRRTMGAVLLTAIFVSGLVVVAPAFAGEWGPPVQLTADPGADRWPSWSPDGNRIAFVSNRLGSGWYHHDIWVMDEDGSNKAAITNHEWRDTRPSWHPNGDTIVFCRTHGWTSTVDYIWTVDVAIGEPSTHELLGDGYDDQTPGYSPDGTRIVFGREIGHGWEIFTIDKGGGDRFQVTHFGSGSNQVRPSWHPDGQTIVFASLMQGTENENGIWEIKPSGIDLRRVYDYGTYPRWSPDGTKIVFESSEISGSLDIYIVNGDGTNLVQVTTSPADDRFPTWSPDGRSIAFASDRTGNWDVWVTTRATETARPLKENVMTELEALKPTGDKKLDKKIDKVIRHIEKSLKDKLWVDESHIDTKRGKKVFYEEKKAAKDLMKLTRKPNVPEEIKMALSTVILKLVDADSMLARTAIDDAIAAGGKEKEIEKAEKEMVKAEKDKSKAKYDKAIDHYKHAWAHAQKAVKKHKEPKHEQMAISDKGVPEGFSLSQNYPNPVSKSTTIQYVLPRDCYVKLEVYNTAGQKVMTVVDEDQEAGYRSADLTTERLSAGVYFYRIKAGDHRSTRKMIILK